MEYSFEYVYLVQELRFLQVHENIYKIGRTSQSSMDRFKGYPKGTCVILFQRVKDSHSMEARLIKIFDSKFPQRMDIGREYYEGNVDMMKRIIFELVMQEVATVSEDAEMTDETDVRRRRYRDNSKLP